MDDVDTIKTFLLRQIYMLHLELWTALSFMVAYGETYAHAAKVVIAIGLGPFALIPLPFTDFFVGITLLEWFAIVMWWISQLYVASRTEV